MGLAWREGGSWGLQLAGLGMTGDQRPVQSAQRKRTLLTRQAHVWGRDCPGRNDYT